MESITDFIWGSIGIMVGLGGFVITLFVPCPGCGKFNRRGGSQCRSCRMKTDS